MKIDKICAHDKTTAGGQRKNVRFELAAEPGSQVFVAGTFNDWNSKETALMDHPHRGLFKTDLSLPKGAHEYKFVVNGVWTVDPKCTERVPNGCGSLNSVLHV